MSQKPTNWEELIAPHARKFILAKVVGLPLTLEPGACETLGRLMAYMAAALDALDMPLTDKLPTKGESK